MKKRLLSLVLAAAMGASLFAGCGKQAVTGDGAVAETQAQAASAEGKSDAEAEVRPAQIAEQTYFPELPTAEEQADIYVERIDGLSEDFIKGMDISTLLVEEASGVKYYNENGEEEDLLKILADAGVNYIRVRVWNDPFDENGNGYGGGNCTADTAAEIGRRAAAYGMQLLVDFHYSDFWADPNKQSAPKAWKRMSSTEKADAIYAFTKESLNKILDAGANVGMVQIGNEINNGMTGERTDEKKFLLLSSGSKAVREVSKEWSHEMKVAVHFTSIDDPKGTLQIAENLANYGLDYDIFGVSYYCYWHGTMDNMTQVLRDIHDTYGVDTCVMETSYLWTEEDGDDNGNSVTAADAWDEYPCTVQGQANNLRDVMAHASEAGALGVFYWEGAWVPVGTNYDSNLPIWEKYGSGWASSYAADYDPNDAGKYYGGCAWDNQALFDFTGKKLPSLDTYKYVNYGAKGNEIEVIKAKDVDMEVAIGQKLELPEQVDVVYNDTSCKDPMAVTWDQSEASAIDTNVAGIYTVSGKTADGETVSANIKVANVNYLENPGFEDKDASMWQSVGDKAPWDVQEKEADALSGTKALHFYDTKEMDFAVEQTLTGLAAGTYNASANMQGGDVGSAAEIYLYVKVGDQIYQSEEFELDGWQHWKNETINDIPVADGEEVKVGLAIKCSGGGWGTADDFEFYSQN